MLDWDGTLIDSLPIKIENAARLFAAVFDADPAAVSRSYGHYSGIPRRRLFDAIAQDCLGRPLDDADFADMSERFSAENRKQIAAKGRLRTGVRETLESLSAAGIKLYVSTSAVENEVEPLVEKFGLRTLFSGVLGSRMGFAKGEDHVAYAEKETGTGRDQMAGVGDDVLDIDLFKAARIVPVGIVGTRTRKELSDRGAAMVIDRIDELLPLVAEIVS